MKVLALSNLYPPDFIGGYELACAHAVESLAARGHEVRVLTCAPRRPVPHDPRVARTLRLADVYDTYSMLRLGEPGRRLRQAEAHFVSSQNVHALIRELEDFAPDVVYVCNLIGLGGLGLMAALQFLKVPWVWQLGDSVPAILCSRWDGVVPALAREFEQQIQGTYVLVSRRLAREIEEAGVRLRGRLEYLPYWIRGRRPAPRTTFYRGGHLRIVSAGVITRHAHKGMDLIIQAAAALRASGRDDFSVDLYGRVGDHSFQAEIQRLGLERHVTLRGVLPQAELMERFGSYDLFAFPTWDREPFGMAPLEALSRGCVPVISRVCGISEWLVEGVHCLKADRDAEAFAAAWAGVIDGRVALEPLARRGAAAAWRDFHVEVVLDRIESLLSEAAARDRSGAGDPAEAYRLALLAEKLSQLLVVESVA
jgi:glycogen synthase